MSFLSFKTKLAKSLNEDYLHAILILNVCTVPYLVYFLDYFLIYFFLCCCIRVVSLKKHTAQWIQFEVVQSFEFVTPNYFALLCQRMGEKLHPITLNKKSQKVFMVIQILISIFQFQVGVQ